MTETQPAQAVRTPRHLWVVGIIATLWNAMGAMDYVMTQTRNEAYLSKFTPEQLAYFTGFPAWVDATWAIAVWVFLASLLAMVLTTFYNFVLSNGMEVMGESGSLVFTGAIFVIALVLFLYARTMEKRGVLR